MNTASTTKTTPSNPQREPAIFIVGHGTKSLQGQLELEEAVQMLSQSLPKRKVGYGYLELAHPTIEEGLEELIDGTTLAVTVIPLVLLGAGHAKTDIPGAVEMARISFPGVTFSYGNDLGPNLHLIDAFAENLLRNDLVAIGESREISVLLVGRGSTDPDANSDLFKIGRMLQEIYRFDAVECCFISLAEPSVTMGLNRLKLLGKKSVFVLPYFLFNGALTQRICDQSKDWNAENLDVGISMVGPLGPHEVLSKLMTEKISEAENGKIHMSCDLCVYRTRTQGFSDKFTQPIEVRFGAAHQH